MANTQPENPTNPTQAKIPIVKGARARSESGKIGRRQNPRRKNTTDAALLQLGAELRSITAATDERAELVNLFMEVAIQRSPMLAVGWIEISTVKQLQDSGKDNKKVLVSAPPNMIETRFSNPTMDNTNVRTELIAVAQQSGQSLRTVMLDSEKVRGASIIGVPFYQNEKTTAVLCSMVHNNQTNCSESLMVSQLIAAHYDLWRARDQITTLSFETRSSATVLELISKAHDSQTVREACFTIANELRELFRCDFVAIGLLRSKALGCHLMSVSGLSEFDEESKSTQLFRAAFDEATVRGNYTAYPSHNEEQRSSTLCHKKLAKQMRCEAAITIPMRDNGESIIGAITIVGNRQLDRNAATRNLITALEHPVGSSIQLVKYAEGGWLRRMTRMLVSSEKTNMMWAVLAAILISLIAMFVPVSYRINCDCTAEPVIRRFSVAPYDGLLETTLVEPGDRVEKGQLLARMDGREIRFERAGVEADMHRALKKRDNHRANSEIPDALMADLDRARLESRANILAGREAGLEITSPVTGIVLSGSIDRRENYPVTVGESLYEIAPLDPLRVELAIPAEEVMYVEIGQIVKFRFDGFGTQTVEGVVSRIRPSSTIRDEKNVFVAEALLPNKEGEVRPGMNGNARIYGNKRMLGWAIFHRPWERVVTAIGF